MGYNITIKDENRICHIINNKSVFPELNPYPEYVRKLRKILKIGLNNSFDHSHSEMIHLASTKWIKTLHSMNYELAVVWFEGTIPKSNEFEIELLKLHDGEWKDRRWLVAGHILNHENRGRYPYWHHQCIVINIRAYAEADFPNLNKYLEKRPAFKASEENFHDDYTPYYLKPMPDSRPELIETRHRFLDALIPNSLKLGYEVLNLPQQVRDHKECIYPEDDVEDTVKWLLDDDFISSKTPKESLEFGYNLPEDKMELYGFKNQQTQVLYITNTESIPKFDNTGVGFTHMMVPCSGLHQFWHLGNHVDTLDMVTFYDFNPYALEWTNIVIKEWDPRTDFTKFYEDNIQRVIGDGVINSDCCIYDPKLVEKLIEHMGGPISFAEKIDKIKKLNIKYMQIDAVKDWRSFARSSGHDHNLFIQVTNIWQYEINYLNTSGFTAQMNFIKLIMHLLDNHREVYFTGNTPGGLHYTYQNAKLLTGLY